MNFIYRTLLYNFFTNLDFAYINVVKYLVWLRGIWTNPYLITKYCQIVCYSGVIERVAY